MENEARTRDEDIITLTLDDDSTLDCEVVGIFEALGHEYIALIPMDGEDAEKELIYIYRYSEDENGEPVLENIEDDGEFEAADFAFNQMLDKMESEAED